MKRIDAADHDDRTPMKVAPASYAPTGALVLHAEVRDWRAWLDAHDASLLRAARVHVDLYARGLEAAGRAPSAVARRLAALASLYTSRGESRRRHATVRPHARAARRPRGLHRRFGARLKNADRLSLAEPPGLR